MWFQIAVGILMFGEFVYAGTRDPPTPLPGSMSLPKTDEGSAIPIIYGTCRISAPVLAWAGNWFPSVSAVVTYFIHLLWVVGAPFSGGTASINSIYANNFKLLLIPSSPLATTPPTVSGRSTFVTSNGFQLFGGVGRGGGIVGNVEFWDGRPTQQISDGLNDGNHLSAIEAFMTGDVPTSPPPGFTLSNVDASLIPSYRNLALAFLWDWDIGEAPNMVPYAFDVTSLSTGSAADMGRTLPLDADPAAVIYDLLTGGWGRLALPASKVDLPSFQAASITLFNEGHGYSRAVEQTDDALTVVSDVLRQINGQLYEEPTTGRLVLKLIRPDYNLNALPTITPDNAMPSGSGWYQVDGWSETMNQVRVIWTNRNSNYMDAIAIAQNAANVTNQGGKLRSIDIRFAGCCDPVLAQKLAARELASISRPQATATVVVNRSFYASRPGDALLFTWPQLGISNMVMRATNVDLGQLHKGAITLKLIRDVFDVSLGAFPPP